MNPQRWTDERIDDLAADVRTLKSLMERVTTVEVHMVQVGRDTQECLEKLDNLDRHLGKRDDEQRRERKADRRWMIATAMSAAGLVIAALAILAGSF